MSLFDKVFVKYQKTKVCNYFMVSFPKAGRTWVRFFLNYYYFYQYPFAVTEKVNLEYENKIPFIRYAHPGYSAKNSHQLQQSIKKFLTRNLYRYKIIFLIRDPRDIFVSYYYQLTKRKDLARSRDNHVNWDTITLSELVYHDIFGISRIIEFLNQWHEALQRLNREHFILQYERLIQSPQEEFPLLLEFLGEKEPNQLALEKAIEESSFSKMKQAEKSSLFSMKQFGGKADDDNSMKVREGKTGNFQQYFSEREIQYINQKMEELHPELRTRFKI